MNKQYVLYILNHYKTLLQNRYKIKKIGLFGSYAVNKANKQSDIDIYVEFYERNFDNITGLWNFLEEKFHKKIDLIYKHNYSKKNVIENIEKRVIYG